MIATRALSLIFHTDNLSDFGKAAYFEGKTFNCSLPTGNFENFTWIIPNLRAYLPHMIQVKAKRLFPQTYAVLVESAYTRKPVVSALSFTLLLVFFLSQPALAAKTDILVMDNGDNITGEIKQLRFGKLSYSTDNLGTIEVEWIHVHSLVSQDYFQVDLEKGERIYGSLTEHSDPGMLRINFMTQYLDVPVVEVVAIRPIKQSFWAQIDGSFNVGLSITRASEILQFNLGGELKYRSKKNLLDLNLNSIVTTQKDEEPTRRQDITFSYTRLFAHRWQGVASTLLQENQTLGISLRWLLTASSGYIWVRNNYSMLSTNLGLALNEENTVDNTRDGVSTEGLVSLVYRLYLYDTPKTDITVRADVYPSFTISDRVRVEGELSFRRELVKDFFWDLSFLDSYDSNPPPSAELDNDWSVITSLGYSW